MIISEHYAIEVNNGATLLRLPGCPAIGGMHDASAVPHGPAMLRVREGHKCRNRVRIDDFPARPPAWR
jgi:hypothetical protein